MEFRELKTFQVAAILLSFSKAAEALNYAQSTVSSQIQSLENSLGETLFDRSGNKITLTKAGVKLLEYTQRLINLEKEILCNFKSLNGSTENLVIKAPHSVSTYFLPSVIKEFQLMFPNIGFDLDGCLSYNMNDIFNAGLIDLAFIFTDDFSDKLLHVEELAKVELVFVSNPRDDVFNGTINSVADFNDKILLFAKSDCNYRKILEKMLSEANVTLKKKIEINNPEAVKQLLMLGGNGVALLPKVAIEKELSDNSLKSLKWNGPDFNVKLYMVWNNENKQSEAAQAFIHTVRNSFKHKN
jgi:DNA-binding transcriptional LysR family regulator